MKIETIAVHAGQEIDSATGAVAPPIHMSTTFVRDAEGNYPHGFVYGRGNNPTREGLDRTTVLEPLGDGAYVARLAPLTTGHWLVTIDTDTWRLPSVEVTAPLDLVRLGTAAAH